MQEITIYKSNDGKTFADKQKCIKYEKAIAKLDNLFNRLPKRPEDDEFTNGKGYIQHDPQTYLSVVSNFVKMACEFHDGLKEYSYNTYGFWRFLDDTGSPFYFYGNRFLCTDENTFREYGQPYFKHHTSECKGGQLNKS